MKLLMSDAAIQKLEQLRDEETDEAKKQRLTDTLAEVQGYSLTGDAHTREGGDETS